MKRAVYCAIFISLIVTACGRGETYREGRLLLGTQVNLTLVADSPAKARQAFDAAFAEIARIEALMSPVKTGSDVFLLNHRQQSNVKVTGETMALLRQSCEISRSTEGCFDISFAALSTLWNFSNESFVPPPAGPVTAMLQHVGYQKMSLADDNTVVFQDSTMKLGLGGIAKGYAVGRAVQILRQQGITHGIVEAGGDLQVIGRREDGVWRAGLVHPRSKHMLLSIPLEDGQTVATSGDYERCAVYQGKRYHHILDPRTGFPAEQFSSVSVICDDPVEADALATAFFVMGFKQSKSWLRANPGVSVIFIDREMKVYASKRLQGQILPLNDIFSIQWF